LSLGADYIKQIIGSVNYYYVKSITVDLSNVSIEEIADNRVFEGLAEQQPGCTEAIKNALGKSQVGFLQNALRADGMYTVTLDSEARMSLEARQELLRGLALQLGVSPQGVSDNRISGKNMYWGVLPPSSDLVRVRSPGPMQARSGIPDQRS